MIGYYRSELVRLFTDLNSLKENPKNVCLCFSIQEKIINRIRRVEYKIRTIKKETDYLRKRITNDRLSKADNVKLKEIIAQKIEKKDSYTNLLSVYRDIGDGIAYIYLSKWDIKPLCLTKEHAGFISGKRGLKRELLIFRFCKTENTIAIFNDITNSLRHGDITIPKYGFPLTIEVKAGRSSKNSSRAQRQQDRLTKILSYIASDISEDAFPYQKTPIQRHSLGKKESNHQKKITSMAKSALLSGEEQILRIEKGLYYHVSTNPEFSKVIGDYLPKNGKWICSFVNTQKKIKEAYYPFTLSISNPEALFEFYAGNLFIMVFVNLNFIENFFTSSGFTIKFLEDGPYFLYLDHPSANMRHAQISQHFVGRLFAEFLSLDWMIKERRDRILNHEIQGEISLEQIDEIHKINEAGLSNYQDAELSQTIEKFMRIQNIA